jgi:sugar transferase (PEP-CTERM system associated)
MFSLRTFRGTFTVMLTDAVICYLVFWFFLSRFSNSPEWMTPTNLYGHLVVFVFTSLVIVSFIPTRFYSVVEYTRPFDLVVNTPTTFLLSFGFIAILSLFIESLSWLDWRMLIPITVMFLFLLIFRYILFFLVKKNRERILILGITNQAREIIKTSQDTKFRGYEIIGILTTMKNQIGEEFQGVKVLGLVSQVEEIVKAYTVDNIVVTLQERRGKMPVRELLQFKLADVRIQEGPSFYETVTRKIIIDEFLKPSWIIFEEGFFHGYVYGTLKHIRNVIISSILLAIFFPIFILVAILIKLDSPGPVFFKQERVGLNGKIFKLLKFRSMHEDAETTNGPMYAQENDPRITRVGRVLRKMRLDEVPQFYNIFAGDMDFVGPRPERPFFVNELQKQIPYYYLRHMVRPGVTGWAQVNYTYGDSLKDAKEKLEYDLYYIKNTSWYLDALIVYLTIKEVLFLKGR